MSLLGWRTAAMAGVSVGLACSCLLRSSTEWLAVALSLGLIVGGSLAAQWSGSVSRSRGRSILVCLGTAAACSLGGLLIGQLRADSIAAGALRAPAGQSARAVGTITAWTKESDGSLLICLATGRGRIAVSASGRIEPDVGRVLVAEGRTEQVPEWRSDWFERRGIAIVLAARRAIVTEQTRGGVFGAVDSIRRRAESALSTAMRPTEAALARGFVLGQDQEIPLQTEMEFRRSGLTHLLAVSGQNVVLLSVLAWPFLALMGLRLRERLLLTAGLIVIYVLVTGAGPSIQRAGVMGLAAIGAGLNGRPSLRLHALLLAAALTLAMNPFSASDPGWLLSFSATAGIMLWARPLADTFGPGRDRGPLRGALVEAAAVTAAATLATAPVGAAIFGTVSLTALPANLLVAPAVAPAMWLGMLAAAIGQLSILPVAPLNWLDARCLGFIEEIAHLFGSGESTMLEIEPLAPVLVPVSWALIALAIKAVGVSSRRRRGQGLSQTPRRWLGLCAASAVLIASAVFALNLFPGQIAPESAGQFTLCALDVGQGDSILLDPPGEGAALVDTGPPGSDVASMLRTRGVSHLTSLVITHDQSDHNGGTPTLLRSIPVASLFYTRLEPGLLDLASTSGTALRRISEGDEVRVGGGLKLSVLWPPETLTEAGGGDPNGRSLVLLATWRHFTALLTADAESEATPVEPGVIDLLKVAHHGSVDQGLDGLLEHSVPKLALISVGEENTYGHPTPQTLSSLTSHQVTFLRTDRDGSVGAEVGAQGWSGGGC